MVADYVSGVSERNQSQRDPQVANRAVGVTYWLLLPRHPGNDEVQEILTAVEMTGRVLFMLKVRRCVPCLDGK